MRWFSENKKDPKLGDKRTREYFAIFPVSIHYFQDKREYRWLENVKIRQVYNGAILGWENLYFVEK